MYIVHRTVKTFEFINFTKLKTIVFTKMLLKHNLTFKTLMCEIRKETHIFG